MPVGPPDPPIGLYADSVGDTEVPLLKQWLLAVNPSFDQSQMPETEVPLLKSILAAYGGPV